MGENSTLMRMKWLILTAFWCGMIAISVFAYKWWWEPAADEAKEVAKKQEHTKMINRTSSHSRYKYTMTINADSFSGYALLRSRRFKSECAKKEIRVVLEDDGANYPKRLKDLADGKCQMAVFTIDALIKASANYGDLPATIVSLIDETKGADAAVALGKTFPNVDAMNDPKVRIVVTPDSPSEFMGRVIMHHYNLPLLPENPFVAADGAGDVYDRYKRAKPTDKNVFILWEPYVSKIVENPDYHVLIASDKFRGYIVDVLVTSRKFLDENPQQVEDIVKAYLTTAYEHRLKMTEAVMEDARQLGEPLKREQAERLVKGIWWKNTTETFGHFGLTSGHNLQHMEEMCSNITEVLIKTGAIDRDPTDGNFALLYYDGIIQKLFDNSWHPGFGAEGVRKEKKLSALSDQEWKGLKSVGTLKVSRLVFGRGTSRLTPSAHKTLDTLSEKLETWPQYYLIVRGHSKRSDDPDIQAINQEVAAKRADAAVDYLLRHGVDRNRIHSDKDNPNGSTTVQFLLGEVPY